MGCALLISACKPAISGVTGQRSNQLDPDAFANELQ
jgi:hypothetical protein